MLTNTSHRHGSVRVVGDLYLGIISGNAVVGEDGLLLVSCLRRTRAHRQRSLQAKQKKNNCDGWWFFPSQMIDARQHHNNGESERSQRRQNWSDAACQGQNEPGGSSQLTDPDESHEPFRKAETLIRGFLFAHLLVPFVRKHLHSTGHKEYSAQEPLNGPQHQVHILPFSLSRAFSRPVSK